MAQVIAVLDSNQVVWARLLDVSLEQYTPGQWRLYLHSNSEAMLEKWALAKRKLLFQEVFGVKLEVM